MSIQRIATCSALMLAVAGAFQPAAAWEPTQSVEFIIPAGLSPSLLWRCLTTSGTAAASWFAPIWRIGEKTDTWKNSCEWKSGMASHVPEALKYRPAEESYTAFALYRTDVTRRRTAPMMLQLPPRKNPSMLSM